jgi:PST family polysaccharide transporter
METFDPPHNEIKAHAASGFIFSSLAQGLKMGLQFLSVIVMSRVLEPSDFGIVAMVYPTYTFAMIFQNLGINQAVIQRPHLTPAQVNTFFWINIVLGTAAFLAVSLLSPAVAWFYHDRRTMYLTMAMAVLLLVAGIGNLHGAIMVRRLQFRQQTILNIVAAVASLMASVLWGYWIGGYWSLYVGLAVGSILPTIGCWMMVKWRPSWPHLVPETGEMLRFGMGVTAANLANTVASSAISMAIGRALGEHITGMYDRASKLVSAPLQQMTAPINQVTGPILYRLHDDPERYVRTFQRMAGLLLLIVTPFIAWVVAMSALMVETLLGAKWVEATPVFAMLSLAALPRFINGIIGWIFVTQGRAADNGRWGVFSSTMDVFAVLLGLSFGAVGVAAGLAISQIAQTPLLLWYACRRGSVQQSLILKLLRSRLLGGTASYAAARLLLSSDIPPWPTLIAGGILSYLVSVAVVALFPSGREALLQDFGFLKYVCRHMMGGNEPNQPAELNHPT